MRRLSAVIWLATILVVGATGFAVAQPVALVLELDGGIEPAVEPFSELSAGDTVRLSDDATLLFLHYPTCAEITVRGGRLVLSSERYTLQGGKIVGVDRARCPKTVLLSQSGQVGGVLIRSGGSGPVLGPRPEFVLAGSQIADVESVRVRDGDRVVGEGAMTGRGFEWPKDAADLPPKTAPDSYTAELIGAEGTVLRTFEFSVAQKRGRRGVTVVRFD